MNILVLSNFYPPFSVGGYELGCRDVVETLRSRGHAVSVLTSTHGVARATTEGHVHRWLPIDLAAEPRSWLTFAVSLLSAEARGGRALRRLIAELRPDVVYAWNLRYLPLSLVRLAGRRGLPVCFFVSDEWMAHWETVDRWEQWAADLPAQPAKRAIKRLLVRAADHAHPGRGERLDLRCVQFASRYLAEECRRAGKAVERAAVVHWGVDTRRFAVRDGRPRALDRGPRLLYAGQLVPAKGVHTAIEACRLLVATHGMRDATLTIAGGSVRPDYRSRLQSLAREAGLADRIRFTGALARERMPALYHEHDILVFPSIWAEPFSITLLEAMASGLAVVGTATGGSAEILRHGVNALVFPPEDAAACALHVRALVEGPELYERIRAEGLRAVEREFDLARMVDAIERDLQRDTS